MVVVIPVSGQVHNLSVSRWLDGDGLLGPAVEELAWAARSAVVEAERGFVEIVLKTIPADRSRWVLSDHCLSSERTRWTRGGNSAARSGWPF